MENEEKMTHTHTQRKMGAERSKSEWVERGGGGELTERGRVTARQEVS